MKLPLQGQFRSRSRIHIFHTNPRIRISFKIKWIRSPVSEVVFQKHLKFFLYTYLTFFKIKNSLHSTVSCVECTAYSLQFIVYIIKYTPFIVKYSVNILIYKFYINKYINIKIYIPLKKNMNIYFCLKINFGLRWLDPSGDWNKSSEALVFRRAHLLETVTDKKCQQTKWFWRFMFGSTQILSCFWKLHLLVRKG